MKSSRENWEQFSGPMKQALENLSHIKDNISDTIADKIDERKAGAAEETMQDKPKEHGGCLKKVLVYGFIIIALLAFLRNGCSFNSTIERDGAVGETMQNHSAISSENQSLYNLYVQMTEENITALVAQETIDVDALEDEYMFLLTCLVSEYMFKSMANGHFTGDYETKKHDYLAEKCSEVEAEMRKYIDGEIAGSMYVAISAEAYAAFDDAVFNYDSCLVGTAASPDINAMWNANFNSLIGTNG